MVGRTAPNQLKPRAAHGGPAAGRRLCNSASDPPAGASVVLLALLVLALQRPLSHATRVTTAVKRGC